MSTTTKASRSSLASYHREHDRLLSYNDDETLHTLHGWEDHGQTEILPEQVIVMLQEIK